MTILRSARTPVFILVLMVLLAGCGGGNSGSSATPPPITPPQPPPPPSPSYDVFVTPSQVTLQPPSMSATFKVSCNPRNGFADSPAVALNNVPKGVTAAPATFTLNNCGTQQVTLDATNGVQQGNIEIEVNANAAGLVVKSTVSVEVKQDTTYPTRSSFVSLDQNPTNLVYDSKRKLVYVANYYLNQVEVVSVASHQRIASVSVGQPFGLDISTDGDHLFVGQGGISFINQFISVIDLNTLRVVKRTSPPALPYDPVFPQYLAETYPVPIAAANGTVFWIAANGGNFNNATLVQWDPQTDTWRLRPDSGLGKALFIAASADKRKLLIGSWGSVAIYDSASDTFKTKANFGYDHPYGTVNADGTRFAIGDRGNVVILDADLNVIANPNIDANPRSLLFSPDGSLLYVFDGSIIKVLATSDYSYRGLLLTFGYPVLGHRSAIDETGLIFHVADSGLSIVDATKVITPSGNWWPGYITAAPECSRIENSSTLTLQSNSGGDLSGRWFIGNTEARVTSVGGGQAHVVLPPSPLIGPASMTLVNPNGWDFLFPEVFSYGLTLVDSPWIAAPAGGAGDTLVGIRAYGLVPDDASSAPNSPGLPNVNIGGTPATVSRVDGRSGIFPALRSLYIKVPAGTLGRHDLQVSSTCGSVTLHNAIEYVKAVTVSTSEIIHQGMFDSRRNKIYYSAKDKVLVLDASTLAFTTPISLPGTDSSTQLAGISMTPDFSYLLVADYGNNRIFVLDPDSPAATWSQEVTTGTQLSSEHRAYSIAGLAGNKAAVFASGVAGNCGVNEALRVVDLTTRTVTPTQVTMSQAAICDGSGLHAVSDGSWFIVGDVGFWVKIGADGTFRGVGGTSWGGWDGAVSGDGNRVLDSRTIANSELRVERRLQQGPVFSFPTNGNYVYGTKLHPTGALAYLPFEYTLLVYDANTGLLRKTVMLPEKAVSTMDGLVIDSTGSRAFVLTASGVTAIDLGAVPLGVGSVAPAVATAGAEVTLRGSGLGVNSVVNLNGKTVAFTYIDPNTGKFVVPPGVNGPVRVAIENPDGDSAFLDAAMTVN